MRIQFCYLGAKLRKKIGSQLRIITIKSLFPTKIKKIIENFIIRRFTGQKYGVTKKNAKNICGIHFFFVILQPKLDFLVQ